MAVLGGCIIVGLIEWANASALASAPVAASEGCNVIGKGSLLRVRIDFKLGDIAPRRVKTAQQERLRNEIDEFEARTERAFNESGYNNADGTRVLLDIDATSFHDRPYRVGDSPGYHRVVLFDSKGYRDRVVGTGTVNDQSSSTDGYWRRSTVTNPQDTDAALHEIGHQLGLEDAYRDDITDRSGRRQVERPEGMHIDRNGKIIEPQRWRSWARRYNLDPDSLRYQATPNRGHRGDIMAYGKGRFRDRDLRKLLHGVPNCRDEDNELFDRAELQPKFDTRGPRQGRTCYTHLKPPLRGLHYIAALQGKKNTGLPTGSGVGAPFVAYWAGSSSLGYERDVQLLRYAHLEVSEVSEVKIACNWRKEVAYIKKVMELFRAIEKLNKDNIKMTQTAQCDYYHNRIDKQTEDKVQNRLSMIIMDSVALESEVIQRLATVTGAFRLKRYGGSSVHGYLPSDFPSFNRMANDIDEKLMAEFRKSSEAAEQTSVAVIDRHNQCFYAAAIF